MRIDARGIGCPKPLLMAEEELNKISEGFVEVLVDNEASVGNLKRFASKNGMYAEDEAIDNYWRVRIVKGYVCEPVMESAEDASSKGGLFVVIATDIMGREERLGRILMKAYLETMKVYKELPEAIFFMNTAVRLTTIDEEILPIIREIADMGVEIYSCGTCLKYFNLESELKVGFRGTTNHIVEGLKEYKKTVWIG